VVKVNGVVALAAAAMATTLLVSAPARAELSAEELAKRAQNHFAAQRAGFLKGK
jgi:hypothetical protein